MSDNRMCKPITEELSFFRRETLGGALRPSIHTGFPELDELLGGGIFPGLIVLGAMSSLGKSTFALQLAQDIAAGGTPALVFSLEMPARRILSKALSREMFLARERKGAKGIQANELMVYESVQALREGDWQQVQSAADQLQTKLEHFYIQEGLMEAVSAEEICASVTAFIEAHPELPKPFVLVDYLQILGPSPSTFRKRTPMPREIVDDSVRRFHVLASQGVPVLLISAVNRTAAGSNRVNMESFKESGGIEYSADVVLGMQFTGQNVDIAAQKSRPVRSVDISVLKNRYGRTGEDASVTFDYHTAYDCFQVHVKKETPPAEAHAEAPAPVEETPAPAAERAARQLWINNTKIANEIRKGLYAPGEVCAINVGRRKTPLNITYSLSRELTWLDMAVADALYSLRRSRGFTLRDLLRSLSGAPRQALSAGTERQLLESLQRLCETEVNIQCRAEAEAGRRQEAPREWADAYFGPFLSLRKTAGGYQLAEQMPLYRYMEHSQKGIRLPAALMDAPYPDGKARSNTIPVILLKRWLLQQLEIMRNARNSFSSRRIYFTHLTDDVPPQENGMFYQLFPGEGGTALSKKMQRHLEETALQLLESYRAMGYIGGYRFFSEGAARGAEILGVFGSPESLELP